MEKILNRIISVMGLWLLFSIGSVIMAQTPIDKVLMRMDLNNKSIQSLQSDVTMVKFNPQLNTYDSTYGRTIYLPKSGKRVMYLRLDWLRPVEEQISVIGDSYELYRPGTNQVIVGKTGNAKNNASAGGVLSFMSMSRVQLKANYEVVYIGVEQLKDGTDTFHVQLTPKSAMRFKLADLWVDPDGMPRQSKITEQNNDETTILLSNILKNKTIQGSSFKLSYDRNKVKRIPA